MSESLEVKIARVKGMVDDDGARDINEKDREALATLLQLVRCRYSIAAPPPLAEGLAREKRGDPNPETPKTPARGSDNQAIALTVSALLRTNLAEVQGRIRSNKDMDRADLSEEAREDANNILSYLECSEEAITARLERLEAIAPTPPPFDTAWNEAMEAAAMVNVTAANLALTVIEADLFSEAQTLLWRAAEIRALKR